MQYVLYENRFILSIVIINILSFPFVIIYIEHRKLVQQVRVNKRERKKKKKEKKTIHLTLYDLAISLPTVKEKKKKQVPSLPLFLLIRHD
jgi:uncharacterized iron-regulated membrane protein